MAKQEHLERLRQGREAWMTWKWAHPDIQPNLSGANLRDIDLRGINLIKTNLSGADLYGNLLTNADLARANLSEANLEEADLSGASVVNANLTRANLTRALLEDTDLSGADLSGANLFNADLLRTNLSETNLSGADFSSALVGWTLFGNVDLHQVKGLETVMHHGPSYISTSALTRSQGNISTNFLRGAGLDDTFIEYFRSLTNQPIEYYTCFISYSSKNESFAKRLYADLQTNRVCCWFAPEDLKIGDHYHQRIDASIHLYDKLILILSEQAVQSAWVEREVVSAREKEDQLGHEVLFPIRLDDAVMQTTKAWAADVRRRWHIGDFTQWKHHDTYRQAFERLLRDLKAEHKPKD